MAEEKEEKKLTEETVKEKKPEKPRGLRKSKRTLFLSEANHQ